MAGIRKGRDSLKSTHELKHIINKKNCHTNSHNKIEAKLSY